MNPQLSIDFDTLLHSVAAPSVAITNAPIASQRFIINSLSMDERFKIPGPMRETFSEKVAGALEGHFERITLAWQMLDDFSERYPAKAELISQSFALFRWHLQGFVPGLVFQAHVQELLQRVVNAQELEPCTEAEVLMLLIDAMGRGPLLTQWAGLIGQLYDKIVGAYDTRHQIGALHEHCEGANEYLLAEIGKHVRFDRKER